MKRNVFTFLPSLSASNLLIFAFNSCTLTCKLGTRGSTRGHSPKPPPHTHVLEHDALQGETLPAAPFYGKHRCRHDQLQLQQGSKYVVPPQPQQSSCWEGSHADVPLPAWACSLSAPKNASQRLNHKESFQLGQ